MSTQISETEIAFLAPHQPTADEVKKTFVCEGFEQANTEAESHPYSFAQCKECPLRIEFVPNLETEFIEGRCAKA